MNYEPLQFQYQAKRTLSRTKGVKRNKEMLFAKRENET